MRVTQYTLYNNFLINQQKDLEGLNKTQTQISTGKKIEYMDDDPVIYSRFLSLDSEINSFSQIKNSANFAKTFANETDTTLNDITTTLTSFKTKLLQAANDTNNESNRESIAQELQGELNHLRDLANTSIDGKYIFSGSAFNKKPIDEDFKYQGNDKAVKAFLGAGVEREYNITGKELFLGRDSDYKKSMSLNVIQFDKMKANPDFVVRGSDGNLYIDKNLKAHNKSADSDSVPENDVISTNDNIRNLTGVDDIYDKTNDKYYSGINTFFIKGKKSNGDLISTKIHLKNSDTVDDLLNKIGEAFGNTSTSKVVDVSLNDNGEIEIKDLKSNKMITDFFMVSTGDDLNISALKNTGDSVSENDTIADNDTTFSVVSDGITYSMNVSAGESVKDFIDDINNGELKDSSGNVLEIKADLVKGNIIFNRLNSNEDITSIDDSGLNVKFNIKNINTPLDLNSGIYTVSYQESSFNSTYNQSTIKVNNSYFDNRIFKFESNFKLKDNLRNALKEDTIYDVMGNKAYDEVNKKFSDLDSIELKGTDTSGNSVDVNLNVDSTTTMSDLLDAIKNNFGDVDVSLENGEIVVKDNTIEKEGDSKFSLNLTAKDVNGNKLDSFRSKDLLNVDNLYLNKSGNSLEGNVSLIVKDKKTIFKNGERIIQNNELAQTYAKNDTEVMDVISDETLPKEINLDFKDINGLDKKAQVELRDTIKSVLAQFKSDSNNEIIFDTTEQSNNTDKYYAVMGKNVIDDNEKSVEVKYLKVSDGNDTYEIALNDTTTMQDIVNNSGGLLTGYSNGKFSTSNNDVTVTLQDANQNDINAGFKSNYQIDLNNDGEISYGEIFNIFSKDGRLTPAHTHITTYSTLDPKTCTLCEKEDTLKGVSFSQLNQTVSMLTSNYISPNSFDVYNKNVDESLKKVDVFLDDKGRFNISDKGNSSTKIDFSMRGKGFSIQENNAVVIDEPQIDFFDTLQKSIEAVKNGNNYADNNSNNPRNFGIQGALKAIEHIMDRVGRSHAKIGAISQEFDMSIQRVEMLNVHVEALQSENIDTDLGKASMRLNSLKTSYQALLASIAKINNLTLLNYLR